MSPSLPSQYDLYNDNVTSCDQGGVDNLQVATGAVCTALFAVSAVLYTKYRDATKKHREELSVLREYNQNIANRYSKICGEFDKMSKLFAKYGGSLYLASKAEEEIVDNIGSGGVNVLDSMRLAKGSRAKESVL